MGARSFVCLTNIPTPYRIFQFRLMYQELAAREWDFEVLFMARWDEVETGASRNQSSVSRIVYYAEYTSMREAVHGI